MNTNKYQTPHDIAVRGFAVLVENLGVGGALRFVQQYERGEGDYTAERKRLLRDFSIASLRPKTKRLAKTPATRAARIRRVARTTAVAAP